MCFRGWMIWLTGIHASPIQALPIIFLGSSYRNMTWNVITFSPDQTASLSVSNWNSQCGSNKVSFWTHNVFLHASLHVIKILHLFWLVIASDWSLAPFTYLRKNRSTVIPWGSNHQVRVVLHIQLLNSEENLYFYSNTPSFISLLSFFHQHIFLRIYLIVECIYLTSIHRESICHWKCCFLVTELENLM